MKNLNLFTYMMIIATFAFVLRLFDLSNFSTPHSIAESAKTTEQKFEKVAEHASAAEKKAEAPKEDKPVIKEGDAGSGAAPIAAAVDAPPPGPLADRPYSASELDVLQNLSKRRDELDKRDQQLGQKEALLKAAEVEVDRKIVELNKIKSELMDLLNKQQKVQANQVESLVKIYEGMKPKEAARIFDTLDMDVLLAVISKMKEAKSSPILANMDPEKARTVTIKLSELHRLPDTPEPKKTEKPADKPAAH